MVRERREARARAAACGTYPRAATAAATRASVSRFTLPCAFRTRLTVAVETPACCATSFRVAVGSSLGLVRLCKRLLKVPPVPPRGVRTLITSLPAASTLQNYHHKE